MAMDEIALPFGWQDVPEVLLEVICSLLPPRSLRRARLVCKHWRRYATFVAIRRKLQPHVVDMQGDAQLWHQQLTTTAKCLPQLKTIQVLLSTRIPEAVADRHLAQLSCFTALSELNLKHIFKADNSGAHGPRIGTAWPLPLKGLRHLPSLQRLTLQTYNLPSLVQLRALSQLSSLTHLALDPHNYDFSWITDKHIGVLAKLRRLRSLELHISGREDGDEWEDEEDDSLTVYQLRRLARLEALKVTLHDDYTCAGDILAAVLPPLTRLTRLEMGQLLGSQEDFADDLWAYIGQLSDDTLEQRPGTPGRPLLHLDSAIMKEACKIDDNLQLALNVLGAQVASLHVRCDVAHGDSLEDVATLVHPSISRYTARLLSPFASTTAGPTGPQTVIPRLALLRHVTAAVLNSTLTSEQLQQVLAACPHLTSLKAGFYLEGAQVGSLAGDAFSCLRKLDLWVIATPPGAGHGAAHATAGSRKLPLRLDTLPPGLSSLSLGCFELDASAPEEPNGSSSARWGGCLEEVTLKACELVGGGVCGLLQQCPVLRALSMADVLFSGAVVERTTELPAAGSVTSLVLNKCTYKETEVPAQLAGTQGFRWIRSLASLRYLEWQGGVSNTGEEERAVMDILRLLPELLPWLPKLHCVHLQEHWQLHSAELVLRQLLQATPFADYVQTQYHFNVPRE